MAEETRILAKERDIAAIVIITVIPCGLKLLCSNLRDHTCHFVCVSIEKNCA